MWTGQSALGTERERGDRIAIGETTGGAERQ